MSYTDEQLRDAAAFLRQAYYVSLPDVSNYHPEYSEEFLQKMDRLCRQYRFRRQARSFLKTVVAAVVALLITGSVWLGLSVDARAAFVSFIREVYENTFIYRFFNDPSDGEPATYDILKLPDGYVLMTDTSGSIGHIKTYEKDGTTLGFMYLKKSNQIALGLSIGEVKTVKVGNYNAELYLHDDGSANELVWFDEEREMILCLAGFLTQEQLIEIAESVVTIE